MIPFINNEGYATESKITGAFGLLMGKYAFGCVKLHYQYIYIHTH